MGEGGGHYEREDIDEKRGGEPESIDVTRGTEQVGRGDKVDIEVSGDSNRPAKVVSETTGTGGTPASTVDSVTDGTNAAVDESGNPDASEEASVIGPGTHGVHESGVNPNASEEASVAGPGNGSHGVDGAVGSSGSGGQPSGGGN